MPKDLKHRERNYEVGRGKPPKHTRWQKGQSGNPRGRPPKERLAKKNDDLASALEREAAELIMVRVKGQPLKITKADALAKKFYNSALEGDVATGKLILSVETRRKASQASEPSETAASGEDVRRDFEAFLDGLAASSSKTLEALKPQNDDDTHDKEKAG